MKKNPSAAENALIDAAHNFLLEQTSTRPNLAYRITVEFKPNAAVNKLGMQEYVSRVLFYTGEMTN